MIKDLFQAEIKSNDLIDSLFNTLEEILTEQKEITFNFKNISFISVYFLERFEKFVQRAKDLNINLKINNITPSVYKVFQVARAKDILEVCS